MDDRRRPLLSATAIEPPSSERRQLSGLPS